MHVDTFINLDLLLSKNSHAIAFNHATLISLQLCFWINVYLNALLHDAIFDAICVAALTWEDVI